MNYLTSRFSKSNNKSLISINNTQLIKNTKLSFNQKLSNCNKDFFLNGGIKTNIFSTVTSKKEMYKLLISPKVSTEIKDKFNKVYSDAFTETKGRNWKSPNYLQISQSSTYTEASELFKSQSNTKSCILSKRHKIYSMLESKTKSNKSDIYALLKSSNKNGKVPDFMGSKKDSRYMSFIGNLNPKDKIRSMTHSWITSPTTRKQTEPNNHSISWMSHRTSRSFYS